MPVTAFRADLAFTSAARREQVRLDVIAFLAGKLMFGETLALATPLDIGANGLIVDVRMRNANDADALLNRILGFATGQRTPVAGSVIQTHPCPHDVGPNPPPCPVPTIRKAW